MTGVTPDPFARQKRLHQRAMAVQELINRLAVDLRHNEGKAQALEARDALENVVYVLEPYLKGNLHADQ